MTQLGNFSSIINSGAGAAQSDKGTTVQTFLISLSTGVLLFFLQFGAYLAIRLSKRLTRLYRPRSYLITEDKRSAIPPKQPWKWFVSIFKITDTEIIERCGLDAYCFLRFLQMCLKLFLPLTILIIPILIPINYIGGRSSYSFLDFANTTSKASSSTHQTTNSTDNPYNVTGLDTLSWSNVAPDHTSRYWAHLIMALIVIGWACYCFHAELINFIHQRQQYLVSPQHRLRASARTVLVTGIPEAYRSQKALEDLYDIFPGGLKRIWVNRNLTNLRAKVLYRHKLVNHLENAETNLLRNAMVAAAKAHQRTMDSTAGDSEKLFPITKSTSSHEGQPATVSNFDKKLVSYEGLSESAKDKADLDYDVQTNAEWQRYLKPKQRNTIRILRGGYTFWSNIPAWILLGIPFTKSVDRIYYCRRQLKILDEEIDQLQQESANAPIVNSAFVQFNHQAAAHMACQSVSHEMPLQMDRRLIEISPVDVIWYNLSSTWWERTLCYAGFLLIFLALLLLYIVISAFTGALSRLSEIGTVAPWLAWLNTLPSWLKSFIQGTLPPLILHSLLSGLLPWFIRLLLRNLVRNPTRTAAELSLQLWYFVFLFIILFLVPTIATGISGVAAAVISNPTSIVTILATYLPSAANYYYSYLILQSLSLSAGALLQLENLLNVFVINPLSTNTARDRYHQSFGVHKYKWGTLYPWYSIFAVIGLVYSVIAPLMLLFMLITYSLFWVVSKNNLAYVVRNSRETAGRYFPRAITQLFFGLYFLELCLIGLFFIAQDSQGNQACIAQGVIMVVALAGTLGYHYWLQTSLGPLYTYLPITLDDEAVLRDKEFELQRLTDDNTQVDVQTEGSADMSNNMEMSDMSTSEQGRDTRLRAPGPRQTHYTIKSPDSGSSRSSEQMAPEERQARDRKSVNDMLTTLDQDQSTRRPSTSAGEVMQSNELEQLNAAYVSSDHDAGSVEGKNDPVQVIVEHTINQLENLPPSDVEKVVSLAFEDPALRTTKPIAWIPHDELGLSQDEIKRSQKLTDAGVLNMVNDRNAYFLPKGKAMFDGRPPDYSILNDIMRNL